MEGRTGVLMQRKMKTAARRKQGQQQDDNHHQTRDCGSEPAATPLDQVLHRG
jgi:hypothetical protein